MYIIAQNGFIVKPILMLCGLGYCDSAHICIEYLDNLDPRANTTAGRTIRYL